jgi:hypothetical protein
VRVGVAGDIERLCLFCWKSESVKGGKGMGRGKVHIPRMARLCISVRLCSVDMVGVVSLMSGDWDGMAEECLGDVLGSTERESVSRVATSTLAYRVDECDCSGCSESSVRVQ